MRVLVIGDGAREHALCWKLVESPLVDELYCAPGGDGVAVVAECVPISPSALQTLLSYCDENDIEFVIVDSLAAIENGLVDMLNRNGYPAFGPDMGGVKLEISKSFAKEFCQRRDIPSPRFACFENSDAAMRFLDEIGLPVVIQPDRAVDRAKVAICRTRADAEAAIAARLSKPDAGAIVIEEFLDGEEISYAVITDGNVVLPLTSTTPRWDGEATPSRPGCLSPAPAVTPEIEREIVERIFTPTVEGMKAERRMAKGLLSARIMLTPEGPKVLDYKVRLSDPDWQAIVLRLQGDLMPALVSSYDEMLYRFNPFRWHDEAAAVLVIKTDGTLDSEKVATAVDAAEIADSDIVVFQSYQDRELGVTAGGKDLDDMRKRLRAAAERIEQVLQAS
ncbi:phosphoribosylamine--glycine ligase [Methylocapsa polymorpha]|uniref:Phosphoribosylamine--glycine ligase n=1 Tax=Methylocapsa polymorpha TaxID=3080828 RepID=A0ABZ0HQV3_9HYPH|nr:phosphoribosylamine--glycine ligase [Methylocapsa sp. RX1]